MRKIPFFALAIFLATQVSAQKTFKKTTLYGEFGGSGLTLSVNYERQLGPKPGLGLFIGIGLGGEKPVIPLGAKYLFDLGNHKSYFEAGLGIALADHDFIDDEFGTPLHPNYSYSVGVVPTIGYRHHTPYGLMWRINYTPVFYGFRNIPLIGGFSLGWRI